jgi:dihydrodipicolinate synthase/N-acetylneuraminate lyase
MVVPPFYESPGWAELLDHYATVARAISIPLVVYNIPSASGVRMNADQISELAAIPGVGFIKDSSGDAVLLSRLLQEFGDRLEVLNGLDSLTFYAFAAGARGSVWGAANFMPELAVDLYRILSVETDLKAGRALWAKIWPICQVLDSRNYASAVKTACNLLGIPVGPPRAPARLLADEDRKRLAVALENAGLGLAGA